VIEFVGDEHTPRNAMIRAILGERLDHSRRTTEIRKYRELADFWKVRPRLGEFLGI